MTKGVAKVNVTISVLMVLAVVTTMAAVLTYYPLGLLATPQAPGVIFQPGSNAGQPDIGPNKIIGVVVGENGTSASISINPTYQENYYKDVLRIKNNDDDEMRVWLVFSSLENTLPVRSIIKLFFYDGNTKVNELDITTPALNQAIFIGNLAAGKVWEVDIYVYIPEGYDISGASYSASASLVYTPSTEAPSSNPGSGR